VNKQIGYITSAHLILFSIAASYFFISKISSTSFTGSEVSYNSVANEVPVILSEKAQKGKTLFQSRCASCHHVFKETSNAPALAGFETRGPWADRKQLYKWIRNPEKFMEDDPYTQGLQKKFQIIMGRFDLTNEQIDEIVDYITAMEQQKTVPL
jgi:cytochrome c2